MIAPAVRVVVDASVIVATLLPEQHTERSRDALGQAEELLAPDLLPYEVTSALCARVRRGELAADEALLKHAEALDLPIRLMPGRELAELALELSLRIGHSAYDCYYPAAAIAANAPLLTDDLRLAEVARTAAPGSGIICVAD